ncbi:hypothetical protein [Dermacoccus sp. Tok2021]|uniref:hypothetical protein n=1 Tax=Dermacoccus sp. Tok2021 TaxID=2826873 RepID=UPI001CA750B8|nr:hypothetical protein [Dermacoccus sp. Tok2021]MBZ4496663.1 hypothetical protein [Dermacoccus sp. Tok2021]
MFTYLLLYAILFVPYLVLAMRRKMILTPIGLLCLFNALSLVGIATVIDPMYDIDMRYGLFMTLMASIVTGAALVWTLSNLSRRPVRTENGVKSLPIDGPIVGAYVICLILTGAYYAAVGHVTLVEAFVGGSGYDAASARLDSYAGPSYFAPGYINQFKNALLPVLTVVIIHRLWTRRALYRTAITCGLVGVCLVATAGTGQRGATVLVMLSVIIALRMGGLLKGSRFVVASGVIFSIFSFLTLLTGRSANDLAVADGPLSKIQVFLNALLSRVLGEQALSGLAGFRYTHNLPTANGSEWATDILGILPSYRGSDLSSQIFSSLYGSNRGTSPPSNWGSAYYNFGFIGSLFVCAAVCAIYAFASSKLFLEKKSSFRERNMMEIMGLAGFAVSVGSWIVGSPLTLLNQGAAAYLLVYLWGSKKSRLARAGENAQTPARGDRERADGRRSSRPRAASAEIRTKGLTP